MNRNFLIFIALPLLLLGVVPNVSASVLQNKSVIEMLDSLDRTLQRADDFVQKKEQRLRELYASRPTLRVDEETYWFLHRLFDEYATYRADSAISLSQQLENMAQKLDRADWVADCRIQRSRILVCSGMLKEAGDVIAHVNPQRLMPKQRVAYWRQMAFLISHQVMYLGDEVTNQAYKDSMMLLEKAYNDSSYCSELTDATNESALGEVSLWSKAWKNRNTAHAHQIRLEMESVLLSNDASLDSRTEAMNLYALACLCLDEGDTVGYVVNLSRSAIADLRIANRDIASMQELSLWCFSQGNNDRAYAYANFCFLAAQQMQDRIRIAQNLRTLDAIHKVYNQRDALLMKRMQHWLTLIVVLSVVLALALGIIVWQVVRLRRRGELTMAINAQLADHVAHLDQSQQETLLVNEKLKELSCELQEKNVSLEEADRVKEACLAHVFQLCSTYISKLDEQRKLVNRKIKAGQINELRQQTETPLVKAELKEFYDNFDEIFLSVYPNFVRDLNSLLRPEEQIVSREGEKLNTDLRIYALVRLGINDSTQIADFLHCSTQTVYNNRLKMRNKSLLSKDEFARRVCTLGRGSA